VGRRVKIGIDVGGTFTHAVAVDALDASLVGTAMVPTTHTAAEGVALGVVESMHRLIDTVGIAPGDVVLIAHSTTQATNALLEGDVATVGIPGMGQGWEGWRARSQARVDDIELAPGKRLRTIPRFLDTSGPLDDTRLAAVLDELRGEGAEVLVASEAFGVDDASREHRVVEFARASGWLATAASDISQLYGLKVRTRTAVINASMLPRMLDTANRTEQAVREGGITCPLMVMRSDGGIMDIAQMRRRPIQTMLSGPAAGVAAALAFVKISDGIFLEVGGTSTDISVVRNGRPTVRSAEVGGHRLFVRTLDIRTVGIGGGSMVRLQGSKVADVGPRSAHIAGLGYPSYSSLPPGAALELIAVQPKAGDPADYLAIRVAETPAASLTYTTTEAANALGLVEGHARSTSPGAARVTEWLAAQLGTSAREFASAVLGRAAEKVAAVVAAFIEEYKLDRRLVSLVGGGGGSEVIVRATGQAMGLDVRIADRAEVISAIGVALGMIQDTIERTVVNPTDADLVRIRRAAFDSVVGMGASPDTVEVRVEVDTRQKRLIATARGTPEMRTRTQTGQLPSPDELRAIAATACALPAEAVRPAGRAGTLTVFEGSEATRRLFGLVRGHRTPVRVVDHEGVIRLAVGDARAESGTLSALSGQLPVLVDDLTTFGDAGGLIPDVFLAVAGKVVDLSGLATRDQVLSMVRAESDTLGGDEEAVAILSRKRL
jgi:N-methylhydantoinase A/oxoprolinase/acetone carboxylase beta subunit